MELTILKYAIGLTPESFYLKCFEISGLSETDKTYRKKGTVIHKDKMLTVDVTFWHNDDLSKRYITYCLPEQKDEAIKLLIDRVNEEYKKSSERFNKFTDNYEAGLEDKGTILGSAYDY